MRNLLGVTVLAALLGFLASPADVFADGTETLGPPASVLVASGSGFVAGGTGLFTQPGTIALNVPAGAAVQQVLLYWEGQHSTAFNGDNTIRANGIEVTGEEIGGPTLFFTAADGNHYTTSYRADITNLNLVRPGSNTLTVDGLSFGGFIPPRNSGAEVLVVYDDGSGAADIQVRDGGDNAFRGLSSPLDTTAPQTFNIAPANVSRIATLSLFVGGANGSNAIDVTVNGATTRLVNPLNSNAGLAWDSLTIPAVIPPGTSPTLVLVGGIPVPIGVAEVTVQVLSTDGVLTSPAALTWVAIALSVR